MEYEFVGSSTRDPDSTWSSTSRLINCYREPVGDGKFVLKSDLGLRRLTDLPGVFCRAMKTIEGVLYVIQGGNFMSVTEAGITTLIGTVSDDENTTISSNNGIITIVAGGSYYTWDGTTLSQPATGAFSDFGSVTYIGNLTVLTEREGSRRLQWSDIADPSTLGGLSFATANARDDNVIRSEPIAGGLWVFKETSIEKWGQNGADLEPIRGGTIERGLKAFKLLTNMPDGVAFVSNDNKVRIAPSMTVISSVPVETSISEQDPSGMFYYQDEGHEFLVLTFNDRPSWKFDLFTGEWSERGEGVGYSPWTARACAPAYGRYYIGTDSGVLAYLDRINMDLDQPLIRTAVGRTIENESRTFKVPEFEILARVGYSEGATMELYTSRDRAQTFGDSKPKSLGDLGEFETRLRWTALGAFKRFTPMLRWSSADEITVSANAFLRIA